MMMRCLILLLLGSLSLFAAGNKSTPPAKAAAEEQMSSYLPGVVVVKFRDGVSFGAETAATGFASVDALLASLSVSSMRQLIPEQFIRSDIRRDVNMQSIYNVYYHSALDPRLAAQQLQADPAVEYAEPKYLFPLTDTPNDVFYSSMTQFPHVQAPAAWDIVKGSAGNVVIAVAVGGTDWDHPDLLANIWNNSDEIPNNGIDDDNNGIVDDVRGWNFAVNSNDPTGSPATPQSAAHGTHVGGTIAAVTDNGTGVSSLSWNCVLMPLNAASPTTDRSVAFGYDAIAYAAANGADIVNCSWGSIGTFSSLAQDVIDFAYNNGTLVVAAAGNDGSDNDLFPHYPSNYERVLSVGATNKTNDQKPGFSNYGVTVDVFAPGSSINSTLPNGSYGSFTGTSMASPMAAALAGLIKTQNPAYTVDQLREQVRVTALNIDGSNPGLAGKLGKGRIDALKAVTDFSIPAIRIRDVNFTDSGGDGIINAGETINVTIECINYLAASSGINLVLSESDNNITVTSANATLTGLGSNGTGSAGFVFTVANGLADGYRLRFTLDISSGSYSDRDFLQLTVNPPQFVSHNTGAVQTSITTEGNIGFIGFAGTPGVGFVHDNTNYLFEGGLLIGNSAARVSDCVRGSDGSTADVDFRPASGEELSIISPGLLANEQGSVLLVDSLAAQPLGVSVFQESYADNLAENQDFVIFKYTIVNNNATTLSNVYAGLFFDWDINSTANDFARYDAARRLGYVANNAGSPTRIAAVKVLTTNSNVSHRAVHNPNEIYDGFSDTEKWSFLSGGVQTQSLDNVDISTLTGEGPFNIIAGGSIEVAFAVIGAASLTELQTSADAAQDYYDNPRTGIENPLPVGPAQDYQLAQNYPNPFNPATTIRYSLPVANHVRLDIFNTLGQRVRTLVSSGQSAGSYQIRWDGRNDAGLQVGTGVYIYRLTAGEVLLTRRMLFLQ